MNIDHPWFVIVLTDGPTFVVGPYSNEALAESEARSDDNVVAEIVTAGVRRGGYVAEDVLVSQSPPDEGTVQHVAVTGPWSFPS